TELSARSAAELIRFEGYDPRAIGIVGMNGQREAEIGGNAVRDVLPALAAIVAAIQAPMILQIHPLRLLPRLHHFVHALAELRMLVRQELGANAFVRRPPGRAPILADVHAAGGDGDADAIDVRR